MTWADIVGDAIRVAQQKTAAKLTIPIHSALQRVLTMAGRGHATILVTNYGQPFSVKGFGQMISAAIRKAGLPQRCKAHGLRKAAARRLAEAGWFSKRDCSDHRAKHTGGSRARHARRGPTATDTASNTEA
jgi:hypothetical protein